MSICHRTRIPALAHPCACRLEQAFLSCALAGCAAWCSPSSLDGVVSRLVKEEAGMVKRARPESRPLGHAEYINQAVLCAARGLWASSDVFNQDACARASRGPQLTRGELLLSKVAARVRAPMAQRASGPANIHTWLVGTLVQQSERARSSRMRAMYHHGKNRLGRLNSGIVGSDSIVNGSRWLHPSIPNPILF